MYVDTFLPPMRRTLVRQTANSPLDEGLEDVMQRHKCLPRFSRTHEAMVYGLTLNMSKSDRLIQPGQEGSNIVFRSGDPVPTATCSKYLGSQIKSQKPTDTALTPRFGLASAAYKSLRTTWNSRLPIHVKLRIFQSVVVSTLIYSLDSLTMLPKHFRRLNSIYFRLLRRVVGVKAAYISRVSNITVWELAACPTTPAQLILQQQIKLLLTCLATPPDDPFHHIVFCSALRDRIECNKKSSRGRPPPHWLSLMLDYLQLPINHFFPHHPQITNPMTLQQLINITPRLTGFLVAAPTCASLFPFLQLARPEQQRAGQGKKKMLKTRWWFQFFSCSLLFGELIHFDLRIFCEG